MMSEVIYGRTLRVLFHFENFLSSSRLFDVPPEAHVYMISYLKGRCVNVSVWLLTSARDRFSGCCFTLLVITEFLPWSRPLSSFWEINGEMLVNLGLKFYFWKPLNVQRLATRAVDHGSNNEGEFYYWGNLITCWLILSDLSASCTNWIKLLKYDFWDRLDVIDKGGACFWGQGWIHLCFSCFLWETPFSIVWTCSPISSVCQSTPGLHEKSSYGHKSAWDQLAVEGVQIKCLESFSVRDLFRSCSFIVEVHRQTYHAPVLNIVIAYRQCFSSSCIMVIPESRQDVLKTNRLSSRTTAACQRFCFLNSLSMFVFPPSCGSTPSRSAVSVSERKSQIGTSSLRSCCPVPTVEAAVSSSPNLHTSGWNRFASIHFVV